MGKINDIFVDFRQKNYWVKIRFLGLSKLEHLTNLYPFVMNGELSVINNEMYIANPR